MAQRGLNYGTETPLPGVQRPIIDSAYVVMPFEGGAKDDNPNVTTGTIGCLELCMYAESSRHQEEIIVTGTKASVLAEIYQATVLCATS